MNYVLNYTTIFNGLANKTCPVSCASKVEFVNKK